MTVDGLILDLDVSGLQDATADLEAFPQWLGKEMTVAMDKGLSVLHQQVVERTPTDSDTLRGGIYRENESPYPNLVGRVGAPAGAAAYAIVIEKGRKPNSRMPPVDAIEKWVFRNLQLPPDEVEGAAWAIAKSIAKRSFSPEHDVGPTGAKMFKEGLEASEPHIKTLFDNAIARATQRFNES